MPRPTFPQVLRRIGVKAASPIHGSRFIRAARKMRSISACVPARRTRTAAALSMAGLISALADNAMGLSCDLALGHVRLVTVNLTLDFIAAAKQGEWLEVRPKVVRTGSTFCFATAEIFSGETLCARANAIFRTA
jgi:acyl-coenzyme A thioesterase PaaI-like protein